LITTLFFAQQNYTVDSGGGPSSGGFRFIAAIRARMAPSIPATMTKRFTVFGSGMITKLL
jgi:hypothetical protein